jgi:hypothetical protein
MADKRITELSLHTSLTLSDIIPIVSGNETKKTTYGSLYYAIREGLVSGSSQIVLGDVTNFTSYSSSVESKIQNFNFFTQSYYGDSSSLDSRLDVLEAYSSSQLVPTSSYSYRTSQVNAYVKNLSGAQIDKGKVVRIIGATGDNPLIVTASFLTEGQSANTLGITTENIPNDSFGWVITEGVLLGVDTNGMTAGQLLYLGSGGSFTITPPTAPNHGVRLGEVLREQQNNGSIYVRIDNGSELGEAHDVVDTSTTSSYGDLLIKSGSVWTNSKTLNGDYTITGSLFVSGTTEFGGNLVPKFPSGSTLGTLERPFREIFVSSGSINVASDIPGDPNTSISNIGGNLLVSAGGMRLVGDASFIAATGSFQYLSGSFTHIGSAFRTGNTTIIGDQQITGSLRISGSGFINTHRILTDLDSGSYAITGSNIFSGSQGISGSLYVSESLYVTNEIYLNGNKLFNYGQFSDTTIQSGSANTAYSIKFNTTDISHNIWITSGSRITVENTGLYNVQVAVQLDNPANTNEIVSIWFAVTGSNIPNSNSLVAINKAQAGNEGKLLSSLNCLLPISASRYVEVKWSSTGGNAVLLSDGVMSNPDRPSTPSVILTITQIA